MIRRWITIAARPPPLNASIMINGQIAVLSPVLGEPATSAATLVLAALFFPPDDLLVDAGDRAVSGQLTEWVPTAVNTNVCGVAAG